MGEMKLAPCGEWECANGWTDEREDGLLYLPLPYPKQACISLPVLSTGL